MLKKRLLFIDDERCVLDALRRMLRGHLSEWDMTFTDQPLAAWDQLLAQPPDVVVSDVEMPGLSGLQLLDRIRGHDGTRNVRVIILTGLRDHSLKRRALEHGAVDLLSKPVETEDLIARIRNVLRLKSYEDDLRAMNQVLEHKVRLRTRELEMSRVEIVWRLAMAAELRDADTGNHVVRVACYSRVLADALELDAQVVEDLFLAAPLHDIGKLGVPDAILLKQAPLSAEEREVIERHCVVGHNILKGDLTSTAAFHAAQVTNPGIVWEPCANPVLEMAASIAMAHHEKWNGSGYPKGLAGAEIPIEARIVALADVYDTLTSKRPYKQALEESRAVEIVCSESGRHFDPAVCEAFEASLPKFRTIRSALTNPVHPDRSEEPSDEAYPLCR